MTYSFCVIAYNTAPYISECIESILRQKHHEQIILIDDGSTDDTLKVMQSFPNKEIQIVHHEVNMGCCHSRMEGLKLCTGTYMTFIDSDDYYAKQLPDIPFPNPDIVEYGLFGAFDSVSQPKDIIPAANEKLFDEDIWKSYRNKRIAQLLVNKLIHKRVYTQVATNLNLEGLVNYCDNLCLMSAFAFYAKSYRNIKAVPYFYRQGTGMTTYLPRIEKMRQYCEQRNAIPRLKALGIPTDNILREMTIRAKEMCDWINTTCKIQNDEYELASKENREARHINSTIVISEGDGERATKLLHEYFTEEELDKYTRP